MIKRNIKLSLMAIAIAFTMAGCELFGLELQTPYEYDYEAGMYSNKTNMTAWELIQSRPDLFSILQEGIEFAGMQDKFAESGVTYLLLTNSAFDTDDELTFFNMHKLPHPTIPGDSIVPESLTWYPVDQVKELLLYHIVKGEWTWSNLPATSTWYDTYATADTAKVNMYLLKDRDPNIVFNNFPGHYMSEVMARTTNLRTSNGSYMHALDSWMNRPTKAQLR